jgi:hypothetical protein
MRGDPVRLLTKAIDSWYQESSMYDFDKPGFSANTHRFTQASKSLYHLYLAVVHASALHCHIIALSRTASFIVNCNPAWTSGINLDLYIESASACKLLATIMVHIEVHPNRCMAEMACSNLQNCQ